MPSLPDPQPQTSNECFYWREDGTKGDDWIHEEMLDNPEANKAFRDSVIRDAVAKGMPLETALRLFGNNIGQA